MFGLESYAFDLLFMKRPAASLPNQEKFLAFPEYVVVLSGRREDSLASGSGPLKCRALARAFDSQLKPVRAHFPFAWTRSGVLMKRSG
jgi:hypothetical protein